MGGGLLNFYTFRGLLVLVLLVLLVLVKIANRETVCDHNWVEYRITLSHQHCIIIDDSSLLIYVLLWHCK